MPGVYDEPEEHDEFNEGDEERPPVSRVPLNGDEQRKKDLGVGQQPHKVNKKKHLPDTGDLPPVPGVEQADSYLTEQELSDHILDLYAQYKKSKNPATLKLVKELSKHMAMTLNQLESRLARRVLAEKVKQDMSYGLIPQRRGCDEPGLKKPSPTNKSGVGSVDDDQEQQSLGTGGQDQGYIQARKKRAQTPTFQNSANPAGGTTGTAPTGPLSSTSPVPSGQVPPKPTRPNAPGSKYVFDPSTNQWVEVPTNQVKSV